MYKVSHRQEFHLNSKSQICHKLTLKVISHQIKDNMLNHQGSIRLYKVVFCRKFWLWLFWPYPFLFPFIFCLVWNRRADTKIWLVTKAGNHFTPPRVLTKLILLLSFAFFFLTILHIVQTSSGPKNLFFFSIFLYSSSVFD